MKFSETEQKLARLVRFHRQHVFDDGAAGERHHRALVRLKATPTARAIYAENRTAERFRASERLLRAYA